MRPGPGDEILSGEHAQVAGPEKSSIQRKLEGRIEVSSKLSSSKRPVCGGSTDLKHLLKPLSKLTKQVESKTFYYCAHYLTRGK